MLRNVKIYINNEMRSVDPEPFIQNGRTYVPVRFIAENFGAKVDWDASQERVTINQQGKEISLFINNNQALVNGNSVLIDAAPIIVKGRTVVPLRIIAEDFGLDVKWDNSTKSIFISDLETTQVSNNESQISFVLEDGRKVKINLLDGWQYEEGYLMPPAIKILFLLEHESGATFNIGIEKLSEPISKDLYIALSKDSIAKLFHVTEIEEEDWGTIYHFGYRVNQSNTDALIIQTLMFKGIDDNNMIKQQVEMTTIVLPMDLSEQQKEKIMSEIETMVSIQE